MIELRDTICPAFNCTQTVTYRCNYLRNCYLFDVPGDTGENAGFHFDHPEELEDCEEPCRDDPGGTCTLSLYGPTTLGGAVSEDECCGEGAEGDPGNPACCFTDNTMAGHAKQTPPAGLGTRTTCSSRGRGT